MRKKICGIYVIINILNGHEYYGSSVDIESRWKQHVRALNKGIHHSKYLQRAWNKYGKQNFSFSILGECTPEELAEYEEAHFRVYSPEYNVSLHTKSNMLGRCHTEESKEKMRQYALNRSKEIEYKKRASVFNKRVFSEETKQLKHDLALNKKKIKGTHKDSGNIVMYDSIMSASKDGFENRLLRKCLHGERNTHKGYVWEFV